MALLKMLQRLVDTRANGAYDDNARISCGMEARTMETKEHTMLDIAGPDVVEIVIRSDEKVIWVNVNGVCRLRACRIGALAVKDERTQAWEVARWRD